MVDHDYADRINELFGLHVDTHIQIDYILYAHHHGLADLGNKFHHSRMESLAGKMDRAIGEDEYKARGVIFKDVARIKTKDFHLAKFSDAQVAEIKSLLQPGDIVLTYTASYMSDVFCREVLNTALHISGR